MEGLGAERITDERKLPLLCLKQVDQLNCFSDAMNMYYIRLFIQRLCSSSNYVPPEKNSGGRQKKMGCKQKCNKTEKEKAQSCSFYVHAGSFVA